MRESTLMHECSNSMCACPYHLGSSKPSHLNIKVLRDSALEKWLCALLSTPFNGEKMTYVGFLARSMYYFMKMATKYIPFTSQFAT